jgi:DNA processing protein
MSVVESLESMVTDDRSGRIALATMSEPGDLVTGRLVMRVGAVEAVRLATTTGPLPGIDRASGEVWRQRIDGRLRPDSLRDAFTATATHRFDVLTPADRDWPTSLEALGIHAPLALWAQGDTRILHSSAVDRVTLVGARAATAYGMRVAQELASDLAATGRYVVTGGGYGIDIAALHAAVARGGAAIAVLPGGLDRLCPAGNRSLLERVPPSGVLLSELAPGTAPTKWRLQQRGLLLAALSGATVVVEAAAHSSSLAVVADAEAIGRSVGAVPGPVTSATSVGCHRLLRSGTATITTHADDVIDLLTGHITSRDEAFALPVSQLDHIGGREGHGLAS